MYILACVELRSDGQWCVKAKAGKIEFPTFVVASTSCVFCRRTVAAGCILHLVGPAELSISTLRMISLQPRSFPSRKTPSCFQRSRGLRW
jgi:hypothetical protein